MALIMIRRIQKAIKALPNSFHCTSMEQISSASRTVSLRFPVPPFREQWLNHLRRGCIVSRYASQYGDSCYPCSDFVLLVGALVGAVRVVAVFVSS